MLYFFYGEDTFSLLAEVSALRKEFETEHPQALIEDWGWEKDLPDADLRKRLQEFLESASLFSPRQFLILRNFLSEVKKYPLTEAYLTKILDKFPSQTTLVLAETQFPDRRLKFFKKLLGAATSREFGIPEGPALGSWIKERLKREDFQIQKDALVKFLELLGGEYDLWQVDSGLRNLMLYRFKEKTITKADVEKLVVANISQDVFVLTNFVAEGKTAEAIRNLEQILRSFSATEVKTQLLQIVGALASQLRSLLLVKDLEGNSPAEIGKILEWKEGRVWINLKLAKKFSKERLIKLLRDLKAIDFRLKTSEEPPQLLLAMFFQKATAYSTP